MRILVNKLHTVHVSLVASLNFCLVDHLRVTYFDLRSFHSIQLPFPMPMVEVCMHLILRLKILLLLLGNVISNLVALWSFFCILHLVCSCMQR